MTVLQKKWPGQQNGYKYEIGIVINRRVKIDMKIYVHTKTCTRISGAVVFTMAKW